MKKYFSFSFWKRFLGGTPDRKKLTENFISLSILQGLNYILPLVTLPYLVRILGPEKYGLISFAQAFIVYFTVLTDYGFNLSATREISVNRDDRGKVSEIFSSVIIIKTIIGIFSFLILALILAFIPKFTGDWLIYIYSFGMVFCNVLFPVWFFQGMERMKYITILNMVARVIFTVSIFIFIKKESDYLYVPLINSAGYIIAGVLSLGVVFKNFGVKFTFPTTESIKHQLKEGWHIFVSTVSISLYTTSNAFILGLFTNNTIVGYYSAAEKIIRAVENLLTPISRTVYPYISKLVTKSKEKALLFIRKLLKIVSAVTFIISLIIFILAKPIANLLLGSEYQESIIVLRILAFLPFIVSLSNIFAVQGLYSFNLQKVVSKFVVPIAVFHIFLLLVLINFYSLIGVAIAAVITEILITLFSIIYFYKFVVKVKNI
jgi:polysaccharide transporter, PST family